MYKGLNKAFLVGAAILLAGCAGIPERELDNAFKYQRLKRYATTDRQPIPSEYQDYADKAWATMEAGGTAEYASILEVGDDALLARVHLIRSARHSIDLQTFIWKDDSSSRFLFDELVQAAERGVLVRILIDGLNLPAPPEVLARMAHAHRNLEIALYRPLSDTAEVGTAGLWKNLLFKTKRLNRRMHNKLLIVDGRMGIAGGRNYDNWYFDRDAAFLFRDRDVVIAGPSVLDMVDSFELFWQDKDAVFLTQLIDVRAQFEKLPQDCGMLAHEEDAWMFEEVDRLANAYSLAQARPRLKVYEADAVTFIYDTPRKFNGTEERMDFDAWFEYLLGESTDRLVYQTPYLIYSRDARKGLKALRKKYPNYRVIASSNSLASSDHIHVYAVSFKHRKELYKKTGIDIYESKPYPIDQHDYVYQLDALVDRAVEQEGVSRADIDQIERAGPRLCIHAKTMVLDGQIALVGSHNFDPRSAKLNTECGVVIQDPDIALEIERRILNACAPQNAWTASRGPTTPVISRFSGLMGAVSTALPVFDVWPYRYTTNYELKTGCEPLKPRDPDFQENYIDVGYFPEVPSSSTVIQTRLMKGFLGWARPLL